VFPAWLKSLARRVPVLKWILAERDELRLQVETQQSLIGPFNRRFPPGHFHSALPDLAFVTANREQLFSTNPRELPGIELNLEGQLEWLARFSETKLPLAFPVEKNSDYRYYFQNDRYGAMDALVYASFVSETSPQRIVEVGSGYSTALLLDLIDRLASPPALTCIEPHPDHTLNTLLWPGDRSKFQLLPQTLEVTPVETFLQLERNDILFIDSTHVSKIGSDVNYLFFEILPRLKSGVLIHIHDIFYPFDYPEEWVTTGVAWNEGYLLRAFLQFNSQFRIEFFSHYLFQHHSPELRARLPNALRNGGGSLWLRRM